MQFQRKSNLSKKSNNTREKNEKLVTMKLKAREMLVVRKMEMKKNLVEQK